MIQFGMPSMIETPTAQDCAELCQTLELDFVELNLNFPQFLLHKLGTQTLSRLRRQYGIGYTIHLDDEMSIADFNPKVAEAYRQTVTEAVALAKVIGAGKLNMHMSRGAKYTLPDRVIYFFEAYRQEYLANIRLFRQVCEAAVGDSGILLCVENTNGFLPFQREAVDLLLESPVFGLTFDIGHNYCAGNEDEVWILQRKDRLHHFHIHDALDGKKDHRELGTGELDILRYLRIAEEVDASVVVETKTATALRQSVNWLRTHWEEQK